MDASCKIQRSIHDVRLTYKYVSRILGTYHRNQRFFFVYLLYSPFSRPCLTFIKFLSEHFPTVHRTDQHDKKDRKIYVFLH